MLINEKPLPYVGHLRCPELPATFKYLAGNTNLLAGLSETFEFTTPGAFCPYKLVLNGSISTATLRITGIKAGIEEQIISGDIPGDLFGFANDCCPVACLACLCMPGVTYEVTVRNDDAMAQDVSVVLIGEYFDACPPRPYVPPECPGCPPPGRDKLVGFSASLGPAAESETITITTPGKFCPSQMFISDLGGFDGFSFEGIRSGLKNQIISGSLPAVLFSPATAHAGRGIPDRASARREHRRGTGHAGRSGRGLDPLARALSEPHGLRISLSGCWLRRAVLGAKLRGLRPWRSVPPFARGGLKCAYVRAERTSQAT